MKVGRKATGQQPWAKWCVDRHHRMSKRTLNAFEKAIETRVRRQGKHACQERD